MWDTAQTNRSRLSHDLPCPGCGRAHSYLPCSDLCRCLPALTRSRRGSAD